MWTSFSQSSNALLGLGIRLYQWSVLVENRWNMTKNNEDLIREINELKNEMKQMREVLNVLFSLVMESEEGEEEDVNYPGFVQDVPRFNN